MSSLARGIVLGLLLAAPAHAQPSEAAFGRRVDGELVFPIRGPEPSIRAIAPRLIKAYLPHDIHGGRPWQTWRRPDYARERYLRYLEPGLWGDGHYDIYGNLITRGWLAYSWTQSQPRVSESSEITPGSLLGRLIIARDQRGGDAFSITIGNEIFTTLTPLTFRKAVYNGVQLDFDSPRLQLTGLFSRISAPVVFGDRFPVNEYTNLVGGRGLVHVNDHVTVGGVLVNAHNVSGPTESFDGNPLKGELTSSQQQRGVSTVVLRIGDDSPADGVGGAILLHADVEVRTQIGGRDTVLLGSRVGFLPRRTGGVLREGARVADGAEAIELRYDLDDLAVALDDRNAPRAVRDLRFRLILMNDYRVSVTSDLQTNAENQPVFRTVARAPGNVTDGSNRKVVAFSYGLPTATQVAGVSLELRDVGGFDLYTEFDVNHDYRKYPNDRARRHRAHAGTEGDRSARAWILELTRTTFPWHLFAEAFYLDEDYNTSPYIVDGNGRVDFADSTESLYDFVDDNDDHDRLPDQARKYQDARSAQELGSEGRSNRGFGDLVVLPGWDQNNDFIPDFNQNSSFFRPNFVPDYEEPFLRYASDRPEFLFGMDLNNNGWVDQFENDHEPDYPYKRGRAGYNLFLRHQPLPGLQVAAGHLHERLLADDRRNRTTYLLLAFEREYAGRGRLRLFDMLRRARDDIPDDLSQWIQEPGFRGAHVDIDDPLFARDAWINTFYGGYDLRTPAGLSLGNRLKVETLRRRRGDARLVGLVNRGSRDLLLGPVTVRPRFKSEWLLDDTPYSMSGAREPRARWTRILFLTVAVPVLHHSEIEVGWERLVTADYEVDVARLDRGGFTGDVGSTVYALQLENRSEYLGYGMTTHFGFRFSRIAQDRVGMADRKTTDSFFFMTVYAGLDD